MNLIKKGLLLSVAASTMAAPTVNFSGHVETEAAWANNGASANTSDIRVDEAVLGAHVKSGKATAHFSFIHEEGKDLLVDEATVSYETCKNSSLVVGKQYIPFGKFETNMVQDTLILGFAETNENAAVFNYDFGMVKASAYLYNGSAHQSAGGNKLNDYGLQLATGGSNWGLTYGYIENMNNAVRSNTTTGRVAASVLSGNYEMGAISFNAEYLMAHGGNTGVVYKNNSAEVSAMQVELGYTHNLMGKDTTFAVSYQGTSELTTSAEKRMAVAMTRQLEEGATFALEYNMDENYSVADGGDAAESNTITAELALEF